MASRREFIQTAMLAAAVPLASAGAAQARTGMVAEPAIYKAIFDERYDQGRAFAKSVRQRGWKTAAVRGDVTDLWFHDLALRWKKGPAAIAGVTGPDSLFVLEQLARDVGMRVVERAELCEDGLVSWVIAPPVRA